MDIQNVSVGRVGYSPKGYYSIRCDRNKGSTLRNPFDGGTRKENCESYLKFFNSQMRMIGSPIRVAVMRLVRRLKLGEKINLQCHCAPDQCHTEKIRDRILLEASK